jgi:isopenicillin N synthase-like dioxygenase
MENVPVIDLLGDRASNVTTMDAALRQFGFFYVKNHGVDLDLIEKQFEVSADLFALPLSVKEATLGPFNAQLDIGYVGSGTQSLDPDGNIQHSGDTKEGFMMTNNKLITDPASAITDPDDVFEGSVNFSLPRIPDHAETVKAYVSAVCKLDLALNNLLFDAIGGIKDEQRLLYCSKPFLVLKQMRYEGELSDPSKGKFGAGAHADWGAFTVLATDSTPGLQIQMGDDWLPVPPKPGCLIVNSGNQIAQLTNDIYRSAVHRVVTTSTKPRYSTAVFTYFSLDAEVGPLPQLVSEDRPARHPNGRTTLEYFHFKLNESMGNGGSY